MQPHCDQLFSNINCQVDCNFSIYFVCVVLGFSTVVLLTFDTVSHIILSCEGRPGHRRTSSAILTFTYDILIAPWSCDNQNCLQTLPNVSNVSPVENHQYSGLVPNVFSNSIYFMPKDQKLQPREENRRSFFFFLSFFFNWRIIALNVVLVLQHESSLSIHVSPSSCASLSPLPKILALREFYTKCINNKFPLYSTGNYIQYDVINHNGKECEKEYIYISITTSLCYTAEINTF